VAGVGWTVTTREPAASALADANRLALYVIIITTVLVAILIIAKVMFYVVLVDRQATHRALVTANTELEQKVARRTADLEASNRELEAFSYSVSHDLRAPLRAIDGFTRIVVEDEAGRLSADSSRRLKLVLDGAGQMGILIDDLLSFSRLGRVELKKQRTSAASAAREVAAELKQENPDRRIEFVIRELPDCRADPTLLKLVFRNLIANAVKFTGKRVDAQIEVGCLADQGHASNSAHTYFVTDNGVGFDMRYSDKLFGVFQRLHRAEDFPGTGVGLALTRRVVERHGGKIWAESAPGEGATFWFTFEDANAGS
jgi:light-regulated signal transduction histidine kinase (bacteriophytochrome)